MQNTRALGASILRHLWRLPATTLSLPFRSWSGARRSATSLQSTVLVLRQWRFAERLFAGAYLAAEMVLVQACRRVNAKAGKTLVRSVYLRRGGGRGELVPGASDLDFFLVLEELSAAEEMLLLKEFWKRFRFWRRYFPFLGETLMGDRNELANWLHTPTVRSFEARYSWKLLWGEDELAALETPKPPLLRDVFSECAKSYCAILHPLLREENLALSPEQPDVLKFRNAAKGVLDLFRLHYSFTGKNIGEEELDRLWGATRRELPALLPADQYGSELSRLISLLDLRGAQPSGDELFLLFSGLLHRAFLCLDEIANLLEATREELREYRPLAKAGNLLTRGHTSGKDHYSLAAREVFAERMILRNRDCLRRTLVCDASAHMIFPFFRPPSLEDFTRVLKDLRVASISFNRSSVALPLSEASLRELERSSFLDSPFHAFYEHQETRLCEDGAIRSSAYAARAQRLPADVLQKTFAEISLALRFQPPPDFVFLLENLVALVLQLRVAEECGEIATDFSSSLQRFSELFPLRGNYLKEQVGKYLHLCHEDEDRLWAEVSRLVEGFGGKYPQRAALIQAQVGAIQNRKLDADWKLQLATTDLWVELTPFLRMELNALRERYFPVKGQLKL